jgi:CDP-diacylglycerol--glycerol-3-phosphate 3-phosphatidyltransferase
MLKKGITLGARMSGKVKTVSYIVAGGFALLTAALQRLSIFEFVIPYCRIITLIVFIISVIISVFSFFDYLLIYLKSDLEIKQNGVRSESI